MQARELGTIWRHFMNHSPFLGAVTNALVFMTWLFTIMAAFSKLGPFLGMSLFFAIPVFLVMWNLWDYLHIGGGHAQEPSEPSGQAVP